MKKFLVVFANKHHLDLEGGGPHKVFLDIQAENADNAISIGRMEAIEKHGPQYKYCDRCIECKQS